MSELPGWYVQGPAADEWPRFMLDVERRASAAGWNFDEKSRITLSQDVVEDELVLKLRTGGRHAEVRGRSVSELLDNLERALS